MRRKRRGKRRAEPAVRTARPCGQFETSRPKGERAAFDPQLCGVSGPLDTLTFEELVAALELVASRLAGGELGIEAAADLYEQAELLHAAAQERLAAVEARVERLGPPGQTLSGPLRPLHCEAPGVEPPWRPPAPLAVHGPAGRLGPADDVWPGRPPDRLDDAALVDLVARPDARVVLGGANLGDDERPVVVAPVPVAVAEGHERGPLRPHQRVQKLPPLGERQARRVHGREPVPLERVVYRHPGRPRRLPDQGGDLAAHFGRELAPVEARVATRRVHQHQSHTWEVKGAGLPGDGQALLFKEARTSTPKLLSWLPRIASTGWGSPPTADRRREPQPARWYS